MVEIAAELRRVRTDGWVDSFSRSTSLSMRLPSLKSPTSGPSTKSRVLQAISRHHTHLAWPGAGIGASSDVRSVARPVSGRPQIRPLITRLICPARPSALKGFCTTGTCLKRAGIMTLSL